MSGFWYKIVFIKCGAYPRFTKEQIRIAFPEVFTINIKDLYYIKFAFETNERKGALKLCAHVVVFLFLLQFIPPLQGHQSAFWTSAKA